MKSKRLMPERLSTQRALIGFLQTHPNPLLAEIAGMCGYDFLLMDGEHGVFSEMDYLHTLQAIAGWDILGMVRLREHDAKAVGRYLDMGVDVIVAPNVTSEEQARALVRAMSYPPSGTRGFGASLHRATRYGVDMACHLEAPREAAALLVIIESALGVANVEDIVAVEGVDGVIVGPFDLTAELGALGEFASPAYTQAIARIERAATTRGKLVGTVPHPGNSLEALLSRGHRVFIVGADMPLVREAMSATLAKAKSFL
jgi:4-hydroxy-2-oxoheptanedioate aldolase